MPFNGWEARNGSSSEEEESDDEVVVPRRSGGMFRVANPGQEQPEQPSAPEVSPQQAKQAMLSQIKGMADDRQEEWSVSVDIGGLANNLLSLASSSPLPLPSVDKTAHISAGEYVVTEVSSGEKSDAERQALEEREKLIAAQNAAKAAQAAAIQQAALRAQQSHAANQQSAEAEAEMRAKQEQARAQAEAERTGAEERVAAQRQAQQDALAKAQEAAKKAQTEALAKAQQAKADAEARAKSQQQQQTQVAAQQQAQVAAQRQAQVVAQQQAQVAAQQQAAQAKAQAEAQAKAAQAKAQAEAQARAAQAKAQAEAQAKVAQAKAQAEAQARAAQAKAQAEAQAKAAQAKAQAEAQAKQKAVGQGPPAPASAPKPAPQAPQKPAPPAPQHRPGVQPVQQKQQVQPMQQQQRQPVQPAKTPMQPQTGQQIIQPGMKREVEMSRGHVAFDPSASQNATPVPVGHTAMKIPGRLAPQQEKEAPPVLPPGQKPGNTALRQTAKVTEEVLGNEQIRTIPNTAQNRPTMRAEGVANKFIAQEEVVPALQSVQKGAALEGAKRWEEERARDNESKMGGGEVPGGVRLQDDACWQTQRRVPLEITPPQIGKITIPELSDTHETQPTVIIRKPASYEKVKWNEFPDENKPELESVPRTKVQEWVPVNDEVIEVTRTGFAKGKVNRVWPPPAEEIEKEVGQVNRVKASDDTAWIQQEQAEVMRMNPRASKISRAWPPQEEEKMVEGFQATHMPAVQWPPPEFEQYEQEKVEVLSKHLPVKRAEYQWPPPPVQYQIIDNSTQVPAGQDNAATTTQTTTVTTQRVVRAM